jgi:hypothetical protein
MRRKLSSFNIADHSPNRTNDWLTPQWIIDAIGISDLDPCGYSVDGKFFTRPATYSYVPPQDGLSLPWFGSVYCNPPYDQNVRWLARCREYHEQSGKDVIVLIFNRSETKYFQEHVPYATGLIFLAGRVAFLNGQGKIQGKANAPTILIAYGEHAFSRIQNLPGIAVRVVKRKGVELPLTSPAQGQVPERSSDASESSEPNTQL